MTAEFKHRAQQTGIDVDGALTRLGGDEALFVELTGILVEESRRMVTGLRSALDCDRAAELKAVAHKAKGALGIFGCHSATQLASELEEYGRAGDLTAARRALPLFESELARVVTTLSRVAAADAFGMLRG